MAKIREYLKDENGKPSSTRFFSWLMLLFFFVTNFMILLSVLYGKLTTVDLNTIILIVILDLMMLISIFVPKQLGKIEEVRKIIELAKVGKVTQEIIKEEKKEE